MAHGSQLMESGVEIVAALVIHDDRLALALGPARAWSGAPATTLVPLAAPSMVASAGGGCDAALALGARVLGLDLEHCPRQWTYGPSKRHAIDREPAYASDAPFLRYERYEPLDAQAEDAPAKLSRVPVRVYLARARSLVPTAPEANVLWTPLSALRAAVGGAWLHDLLELDGVTLIAAEPVVSPDTALVYAPAEAGERLLLRVCAKYGEAILFG